jgi:hypothetical protein
VFISRQHAAADPGRLGAASIPGPAYDVAGKLQLLSTQKSDGRAGFGTKSTAKVGPTLPADSVHGLYTLFCSSVASEQRGCLGQFTGLFCCHC